MCGNPGAGRKDGVAGYPPLGWDRFISKWCWLEAGAARLKANDAKAAATEAANKRDLAEPHLARYTEFVAGCQSPRFRREAVRLAA